MQHSAGNRAIGRLLQHDRQKGKRLDDVTRLAAERRLGCDLSDVRVHTDPQADAMARHLSARALTSGSNIVFRAGSYQPDNANGSRLLAHELAHVIQQRHHNNGAEPAVGRSGDALEQEANAVSRGLDAGTPVHVAPSATVPALQMSGLSDFLPDVSGAIGFAARKVFDELGPLDESTVFSAIETALSNPVMGPLIRAHPALAIYKSEFALIEANPGAVEAVWKFTQDPEAYTASIKAAIEPHFESAKRMTLEQGDRLLASVGVSQEHIEQIRPWLDMIVGVAGSAFNFVWEDVIKDTLLFWRLRSERDTYKQAWTNYEKGTIDIFDLIVEDVSIVLNVLGRIQDLVPIVISATGVLSGGAIGGGAGSIVPVAGTAPGAATGSGIGGGAGAAVSEVVGLAMVLGPAVVEEVKIGKAIRDLALTHQTDAEKQQDYRQIGTSAFSIVVMGAMAFLPGLAMRLGKAIARRLVDVISALATAAPRMLPGPRALPLPASQAAASLASSTGAPAALSEPNVAPMIVTEARAVSAPAAPLPQIPGVSDFPAESPVRIRTDRPDLVAVPRPDLGEGVALMVPREELAPVGRGRPTAPPAPFGANLLEGSSKSLRRTPEDESLAGSGEERLGAPAPGRPSVTRADQVSERPEASARPLEERFASLKEKERQLDSDDLFGPQTDPQLPVPSRKPLTPEPAAKPPEPAAAVPPVAPAAVGQAVPAVVAPVGQAAAAPVTPSLKPKSAAELRLEAATTKLTDLKADRDRRVSDFENDVARADRKRAVAFVGIRGSGPLKHATTFSKLKYSPS